MCVCVCVCVFCVNVACMCCVCVYVLSVVCVFVVLCVCVVCVTCVCVVCVFLSWVSVSHARAGLCMCVVCVSVLRVCPCLCCVCMYACVVSCLYVSFVVCVCVDLRPSLHMCVSARPPTRAWVVVRTVVVPPLSAVECCGVGGFVRVVVCLWCCSCGVVVCVTCFSCYRLPWLPATRLATRPRPFASRLKPRQSSRRHLDRTKPTGRAHSKIRV